MNHQTKQWQATREFHKQEVKIGWGTRIRTSINGARTRRPTIERPPNEDENISWVLVV